MTPKKKEEEAAILVRAPAEAPVAVEIPDKRLLGISDPIWNALIAGVVTIFLAWISSRAAAKTEEVRVALQQTTSATEAKLDGISKTGESVHLLVNSAMSVALRTSAIALRRVATLTEDPDDIAAADTAEAAYHEHEKKQGQVDRGDTIDASGAVKQKTKAKLKAKPKDDA